MPHPKNKSQLFTPELAEEARRVNALLIELLCKPFESEWPSKSGHRRDFHEWRAAKEKEFANRPLFVEACRWFAWPMGRGRPLQFNVSAFRSFVPMLLAAERAELSWLYVSTIASLYPLLHVLQDLLLSPTFSSGATDGPEPGSWRHMLIEVNRIAEPIWRTFYNEEPLSP